MITKDRLRQFISWYQSVGGSVSHHELDWFVNSVEEYLNLAVAVTYDEYEKYTAPQTMPVSMPDTGIKDTP